MDEQRNITSVVNQVERQLRREVISVRGNAAMQRERYLEYLRDLRKARWSKDYSRAGWIIEDGSPVLPERKTGPTPDRPAVRPRDC